MQNKYIAVPQKVSLSDIKEKNTSLSASQYMNLNFKNKNYKFLKDFLSRDVVRSDLGSEIGSENYIEKSDKFFMRTKALQEHYYIPEITSESVIPIMPSVFKKMDLRRGDLLLSKDSNIGEIVILPEDLPNVMLSGAIYRLPILDKYKYYLLAFVKHQFFREQLDFIVPKGATIRHAKTMFLDCKIPMPIENETNVINYISLLTQAIVNKEVEIRKRYDQILSTIENELSSNQKTFKYSFPKLDELRDIGRLDTNIYNNYFKKHAFFIANYKHGTSNISELGFSMSRGQNLQESNIGKSIYSKRYFNSFYTLILPKFISKYGTAEYFEYLGNSNKLKTLKKGDIIFGAEGFEKGRSVVIIEELENVITNIHGITFKQNKININNAIFVKCFLDYLRSIGLIDLYAVGGNGGSLAMKYWENILFPNFLDDVKQKIINLYHNSSVKYNQNLTIDDFEENDTIFNQKAGIYELDKIAKHLKNLLNKTIENIIDNKKVDIKF